MKISKLKNNPNNPRIIKDDKFEKLKKSISEFPEMMEKRFGDWDFFRIFIL